MQNFTHKLICHVPDCGFGARLVLQQRWLQILLSVRRWKEITMGASWPTFRESKGLLKDREAEAVLWQKGKTRLWGQGKETQLQRSARSQACSSWQNRNEYS